MTQPDIESLAKSGALDLDKTFAGAIWTTIGYFVAVAGHEVHIERAEAHGITGYRWSILTGSWENINGRPCLSAEDARQDFWKNNGIPF